MKFCRACQEEALYPFLHMGGHPPANAFLRREDLMKPEPKPNLIAYACLKCGLIQVADQLPRGFFDHYLYIPSASETMRSHFDYLASRLKGPVVDIGCNEGLLLRSLRKYGIKALGVDPAHNLADQAKTDGLDIVTGYFGRDIADAIVNRYGQAETIVSTNTLSHVHDLFDFQAGVKTLLSDTGTYVLELPNAVNLIAKNEFDTIYHEHMSTFTLTSIIRLLDPFDMEVFDVESLSIHGGSMRVFSRKKRKGGVGQSVEEFLAWEKGFKISEKATYRAFQDRVLAIKYRLKGILYALKEEGKQIVGYGAPAKGNTLLNYFGIGGDTLNYLVDKNPLKQGLYSPGMKLPIYPVERLAADAVDYLLILPWNFSSEIQEQQKAFHERGGKFIIPVPKPIIV